MIEIITSHAEKTIAKLESMGFPRLDISYTVEKLPAKTAGQAHLYSKIVKINTLYLKEHKESILSDTLPHEICHIYQAHYFPNAKQSHGPEWKRLMSAIGCQPNTYHSMAIPEIAQSRRKKVRYIYATATNKTAGLTKQQHTDAQNGCKCFSIKGELLVWSGKKTYIV